MTLSRAIVRAWMLRAAQPVPADVAACARLHLLDVVGVGLAASALDQGAPYRKLASGKVGAITVLTGARVSEPADAAMINGGLIHSLEFDDTHTASIVHGSSVLAPAALAVAEAVGCTLDAAVRAYLLGYEVLIRIGLAAPGAFQNRGFQITPIGGALVAALVAADLIDASEDERVHAMGIALSQASGVFEFLTNGSTVKSLHPGWAAHAGIYAARLAKAGLTGPETALEGAHGLFASFSGDRPAAFRLTELMADFGGHWHTRDVAFKFVPCCHYLHPFVEAAAQLSESGLQAADIQSLTLRIASGAASIVCEPWDIKLAPADSHAARWSLPIVVAARLVEGRVDHDTFRNPVSPAVRALAAKSRWQPLEPHHFPRAFEAEIVATLSDGCEKRVSIADVYGNVSRPARPGDVLAKFRANARLCLPSDAIAELEQVFLDEGRSLETFAKAVAHTAMRPSS